MAIHDGVVWSRAVRQLPDRPGKLFGGTFGGIVSEGHCRMTAAEGRREPSSSRRYSQGIRFSSGELPGAVRIKRAVLVAGCSGVCKEKCGFLR